MKLSGGAVELTRAGGTRVRVHLLLLAAIALVAFARAPATALGYALVVLLNAAGCVAIARRRWRGPWSFELHALGGSCPPRGDEHHDKTAATDAIARGAVVWGGVLAQLALLGAFVIVARAFPGAHPTRFASLAEALVGLNLFVVLLRLLPVPRSEGADAWRFVSDALSRRRARRASRNRPTALPTSSRPASAKATASPDRSPAPAATAPNASSAPARRPAIDVQIAPPLPARPVIQVIRARSASEVLRELDAEEDRGNLPDVRELVDRIFRKPKNKKPDLPN